MPCTAPPPVGPNGRSGLLGRSGLIFPLLALAVMSSAAAVRTSATFDEVVLAAAGARAVETGDWSLVVDQPPLMPLLYGAALKVVGPRFPSEAREGGWTYDDRWEYARDFFFRVGNDPRALALAARMVAILTALGLVAAAYFYGLWIGGGRTALGAAFLVAFLPDVVAHGAVAYNDVPLTAAYLLAVWALDVAVRKPGPTTGALAGAAVAVALGVKFSAVALAPVALVLLALEAACRDPEERLRWLRQAALSAALAAGVGYVLVVVLYRGDVLLIGLEYGLRLMVRHASEGHPAPAWLLGRTSATGWWYFFPVAFLVKTPVALHLLIPLAISGLWIGRARPGGEGRTPGGSEERRLLASRVRGPVAGAAVFGFFLLRSDLNAGFRYALPVLPLFLLVIAVGLAALWGVADARRRAALLLLFFLYGGSTAAASPWVLSYESEWTRARPAGPPVLLDSSVDWGQGLLALREWMEREGVTRVGLGYFGSALPEGYGIAYQPLPSFLALPSPEGRSESTRTGPPEWTAVSATVLHGLYVPGDPFTVLRQREPDRVLGGTLHLYRTPPGRTP